MSENKVTLEVLEPRGVLENAHREGLSNPRLTDLNGKTLALMSIHVDNLFQFGSELFFNILEEELLKRYPDIKFYRCKSFGSPSAVVNADEIAAKCDAWVEGVKDAITQGKRDVGVFMERAGKPGVSICSDVLLRSKSALQDLNGMPAVRLTTVPATAYCAAKRNEEQMRKVVEGCVDDLIAKLYGLFYRSIKVLPTGLGHELKQAESVVEESSRSYLITQGKTSSLARAVSGSVRIKSNISLAIIIQLIAVVLGILVACALALYAGTGVLGSLEILIYTVFWGAAAIAAPAVQKP